MVVAIIDMARHQRDPVPAACQRTLENHHRTAQRFPSVCPTSSEAREDDFLPFAIELELAKGIAFISAARKGVESVSAVAVERPQNPSEGLRLHPASNNETRQMVKNGLDEVVMILRKTVEEGKPTL